VNAPLLLAVTSVCCLVFSLLLYLFLGIGLPFGSEGTTDFVQYWSAWQLLRQGLNPYDGELMHAVQLQVGQSASVTTMMWNPPWLPVLLSPVLSLPFEVSALCWLLCNLGFIAVIAALTPRALGYAAQPPWLYGLAVCFLPFINCLQLGQLSLLFTCGFVWFLDSARSKKYFAGGLAVVLISIKPHLFLPIFVVGLVWLSGLEAAARQRFILGVVTGIGALVCLTMAQASQALRWWIEGIRSPIAGFGVVPVAQWKTATLASALRSLLNEHTGNAPVWPLWAFPTLGTIGAFLFFFPRRRSLDWPKVAPALVCVGFLCASYGWLFDQSLLVVCQFFVLCRAYASESPVTRTVGVGGLLLIQLAMLVINLCTISAQHYYTWVPVAFLGLIWTVHISFFKSP